MDPDKKCPGTNFRNLKSEMIKCPSCSHENEFFSDESRVRCENCGIKIERFGDGFVPSCIEWCEHARKCVGDERYKEWLRDKKEKGGGDGTY